MYSSRAFGDASTTSQINTGVTVAGGATAAAASAGLLTSIGIAASAVPIIGAVVSGVTLLIAAFGVGQGCGASCTLSTQVVEQVIPLMQRNLAAAQAQLQRNGGYLTPDEQAACVANFDRLWQAIVDGCNQVGGAGGKQCIADRQRGGKYDCFITLRDPISAMPVSQPFSSFIGSGSGAAAGNGLPLLALGLIAAGLLL